jgi:hypothetical protein
MSARHGAKTLRATTLLQRTCMCGPLLSLKNEQTLIAEIHDSNLVKTIYKYGMWLLDRANGGEWADWLRRTLSVEISIEGANGVRTHAHMPAYILEWNGNRVPAGACYARFVPSCKLHERAIPMWKRLMAHVELWDTYLDYVFVPPCLCDLSG